MPPASEQVTAAEVTAGKEYERKRRPRLNFEELGIPTGAILVFKDGVSTAVVSSPRKVKVAPDEEEISLTALTQSLMQIEHPVQPNPYWTYNGRPLACTRFR